ncbi:MAG: oligosaccharide flippase family protein [Chloroflexi bacterium]|nr:oligosaccharide flippase family protein [Chloroflexota bacterium]
MSLAARSLRGAFFLGVGTFLNILIGFGGGIVLARLLQPNDFGTMALATTIFVFADVRVKLQLEQKFLRDQDARAIHCDTFFTASFGLAVISFVAVLIAAAIIFGLGRADLAIYLSALGALGLFDPLTTAIRLSIEKNVAFRAISIIQTLAAVTQFGVTLFGAILGLGLWSLLLGTTLGGLVNLGMLLRVAPRRPRLAYDRVLAREFLTYGIRYGVVYAGSSIFLTQFDNFIIGLLAGTAMLGFYDRAYRTASWSTVLISASVGRITLPAFSKLQDDLIALSKAFALALWMLTTFTTPLALVVLVTAADLVPFLYGEKWSPSIPILQTLAAFAVFLPLRDVLVSALIATGRPGQLARLTFYQALALIVLAPPLTWFFGATGTAVSVGIAFLISAIFLAHFGRAHLRIHLGETIGLPVLNNAIALLVFLGLREFLALDPFPAWMRLGVSGGLFIALYALISWLTSRQTIVARARYLAQLARG